MLNSAEHEASTAHKIPTNKEASCFGILTFMSMINLCSAELSMNFFYNLEAWFGSLYISRGHRLDFLI